MQENYVNESELRIEAVIQTLSDDELAGLTSGSDFWSTKGIERIGLAPITVCDGPHGLRKQGGDTIGITLEGAVPATCFPTAASLASTWNPALSRPVARPRS